MNRTWTKKDERHSAKVALVGIAKTKDPFYIKLRSQLSVLWTLAERELKGRINNKQD